MTKKTVKRERERATELCLGFRSVPPRELFSESLTIRVPDSLRENLALLATAERRNLSDMLRLLLEEGLAARETRKK